ncbi:restriction endonuclease [Streptomyces sp. NPDC057199]|uniref:restriction endonuclease n=1 Tax=Streptomyces sp. NPDC057199 TaxID=3346047 RepID=UPI00364538F2
MAREQSTEDDGATDESLENLSRIGAGHPLAAEPSRTAPELPVPSPMLLNTHELPWETVEHLVAWLAREVEGCQEAWLYGTRGQAQHGIDVVGISGGDATVYQAKDLKEFTDRDLEKAVNKYAGGRRPFGAQRLVIVTTADANRTEIREKLADLRTANPDLAIELWNRQKLSELLRDQPRIVTVFFGPATTTGFCPAPEAPPVRPQQQVPAAQALLRGPVAHLGLEADLAAADEVRDRDPVTAATAFAKIAEQLEKTLYAPHAAALRRQQSAALHAAGDHDAAVRVDLAVMSADLADGRVFAARSVIVRLVDDRVEADEALLRTVNVLGAVAEFEFEHTFTLDGVASYVDELQPGDPSALQAVTTFAEHAIAARRVGLVRDRAGALQAIAATADRSPAGLLHAARLRACLADADPTGNSWQQLTRRARREYPTPVVGLLLARHGRFLAAAGNGEDAVECTTTRWCRRWRRACTRTPPNGSALSSWCGPAAA